MRTVLAPLFVILAATLPVAAQTPAPGDPPAALLALATPGATLETMLAAARRSFVGLDADGDGRLTVADGKLHDDVLTARLRASVASQIMQADLDGDGGVTEDEFRRKLAYDKREERGTREARDDFIREVATATMAADADKDGRITWLEAAESARTRRDYPNQYGSGPGRAVRDVLAYADRTGGSLTADEFAELARGLFASVDTDGNGTISQEEVTALQDRPRARQREQEEAERRRKAAEARAACALPKASANAKALLLSAYQADGLSSTTIGSQDVAVGAGTITVEPGEEPLYVVIASFKPVIWRFAGAVERVERAALASRATVPGPARGEGPALAGATGVPADRVTFLSKPDCLGYFTEVPSSGAAVTAGVVRRGSGKDPLAVGRYEVSGFAIPSGAIRTTGRPDKPTLVISKPAGTLRIEGGGANLVIQSGAVDLSGEASRFYPGGVVEIDPASVVASAPPARYEVLPNQAGLVQLVQRGAVVRNRGGEFVIREKIRFPAELNGAHSVRFLLAKGVPVPDGDPGHSCVIVEETGYPLGKSEGTC